MRRAFMLLAALACASATAQAGAPSKGTFKQCGGAKGKCHRVAVFQGHNAAKTTLRTSPLEKPSGHVHIRAENLAEDVEVDIYKPDGSFDEASLAKLDELWR